MLRQDNDLGQIVLMLPKFPVFIFKRTQNNLYTTKLIKYPADLTSTSLETAFKFHDMNESPTVVWIVNSGEMKGNLR